MFLNIDAMQDDDTFVGISNKNVFYDINFRSRRDTIRGEEIKSHHHQFGEMKSRHQLKEIKSHHHSLGEMKSYHLQLERMKSHHQFEEMKSHRELEKLKSHICIIVICL